MSFDQISKLQDRLTEIQVELLRLEREKMRLSIEQQNICADILKAIPKPKRPRRYVQ